MIKKKIIAPPPPLAVAVAKSEFINKYTKKKTTGCNQHRNKIKYTQQNHMLFFNFYISFFTSHNQPDLRQITPLFRYFRCHHIQFIDRDGRLSPVQDFHGLYFNILHFNKINSPASFPMAMFAKCDSWGLLRSHQGHERKCF